MLEEWNIGFKGLQYSIVPCFSIIPSFHYSIIPDLISQILVALTFGIAFIEIAVCPFGQLIETIFQKDSFLLEMGSVSVSIHLNGFSPDEYPF